MMYKIEGRIEKVEESSGTSDKGAWKRWTFVINGKNYSTFDAEIGKQFKSGDIVKMTGEQSGKYWNMKTMESIVEKPENVAQNGSKGEFHLSIEQQRISAIDMTIKGFQTIPATKENYDFWDLVDQCFEYIHDGEHS